MGWIGCVLFSRQLPNGSHDFFQIFRIFFSNYFIKNLQTTITLTFLTHIISAIGGVAGFRQLLQYSIFFCRLKDELKLVVAWENSSLAAIQNYGISPVTETIEEIHIMKEFFVEDFQGLHDAADAFNKWILATS